MDYLRCVIQPEFHIIGEAQPPAADFRVNIVWSGCDDGCAWQRNKDAVEMVKWVVGRVIVRHVGEWIEGGIRTSPVTGHAVGCLGAGCTLLHAYVIWSAVDPW